MDFNTEKFRKFVEVAINKMGEIIADDELNYTNVLYNSSKENSGIPVVPWYQYFTWNENQEYLFKKWFIVEYCKKFGQNKKKGPFSGEKVFEEFNFRWGLARNDVDAILEEE